jgi:dTDP-4-amino-4,6-dideoxygalactose transaminase
MNKTMNIPLLDLKAQYARIKKDLAPVIEEVLESQVFILGPKVEEFERHIAAYSQAGFGVGVSSGTDALLVSLMALGVKPGDEVVTTPFSFFATAGTISRLGARPVFADIDPVTFNLDPAKAEAAITPKTRCILPVHLFGQCADMDPILEAARRRGIPVLEDAAQSIGAQYKGRRAGAMAELGALSFFPSKNLGGFGDGGLVVTNDPALAETIKALRMHGEHARYYHRSVGGNFRLDAFQAAVLNVKLRHLDQWSAARRANAAYYDRRFRESGLMDRGLVRTPAAAYKNSGDLHFHIYNQYTLRVKDRDGLMRHLQAHGVGAAIYYPLPLHLQECFADLGYKPGDFPESERAASEAVSIPIYPELTDEQKDYVVETIKSFYG